MNILNSYFDKVYVINLKSRVNRMTLMDKRLKFFDIEYERVDAISGPVLNPIQNILQGEDLNYKFTNANYLAANLTHLSIYSEALRLGYENILILEDDLRIHRHLYKILEGCLNNDPILINKDYDLLYLSFIPLTDDGIRWDYDIIRPEHFITNNVVHTTNFWSLMAYGIQRRMTEYVLDHYSRHLTMELDRFFVNEIQPYKSTFKTYGLMPQLFAGDNVLSDNDGKVYLDMLQRSVDERYARLEDYI